MKSQKVERKSGVQLFTNQLEVKAPAKISAFVNNSEMFNANLIGKRLGNLTFRSIDTAYFSSPDYRYRVERKDGLNLFYSPYVADYSSNYRHPSLTRYADPSIQGGAYIYRREIRVARGSLNSLSFSCFAYKLSRNEYFPERGAALASREEGVLFNEFNEEFVKSLGKYDTLAIQEFVIRVR
ncbi:hypothetical protein [Desertivirga brevis]|uniref:hypothetical protein n=1 Tax=Desertivirga brevis TaxID=2810310 RepID=UPI001A959A5E|nr:hypothetical protein [Pedobacter sp. SYSU D00873]